jgi:hypothetical protein
MNSKQLYLGWVRTNYPALYYKALQATFGQSSGLGGLGDDLTDSISSPQLSTVGIDAATTLDSDTVNAINAATSASQSANSNTQGGGTDFWSGLTSAIANLAPTIVQTQAAENLLRINSQRAANGQSLYTSNGQLVSSSMLSPTSASIQQMEAALAGSSWTPLLLIGGIALVAAIALGGGKHG